MIELEVPLGDRSYPVLVGAGARHRLLEVLPVGVRRVAVVTQESIPVEVDPGVEHQIFTMGEGEHHKDLGTVEDLCRDWARWGLTRGDCVVAVGGGVVTDTAGFAAAVYHRGIPVVHVSTTLLGQVDAAIGGKTGVNLPEGKNLVGAFWQPAAVICDTDVLATLPPREYRNGQGEMAKYAFLGVDRLMDLPLDEAVAACVACKAEVVGADEREGAVGRSSTTATRWVTPSRRPAPTTSATVRRWPSAWCTPPSWLAGSAASTPPGSPNTEPWSPGTTSPCRSHRKPSPRRSSPSLLVTRRRWAASPSCSTVLPGWNR